MTPTPSIAPNTYLLWDNNIRQLRRSALKSLTGDSLGRVHVPVPASRHRPPALCPALSHQIPSEQTSVNSQEHMLKKQMQSLWKDEGTTVRT